MADVIPLIPANPGSQMTSKRKSITTEFRIDDWERPFVETFGDEYLAYRARWDKAGPDSVPEFPLHIDFQLMDQCNMRCTFCPRDEPLMEAMGAKGELNRGTKMSLADFKRVIDEGARHKLRAINLGSTSEPLIHPDVVEMVRYARQNGVFDIRMITNGLLLKEKMIRHLYEAGLTYLGVSIDSLNPETYRLLRKNDLSKVVNNTLLAVKIRAEMGLSFPRIRVSFVDSPQAHDEFPAFLEFWKDKVDWVELQDYDDYGSAPSNFHFTCAEPYRRLMVWASGVIGCIAWTAERYPYGHFGEQTIKDAWTSPAMVALRSSFKTQSYKSMCLDCYGRMPTKE